jgi:hypothetical protein
VCARARASRGIGCTPQAAAASRAEHARQRAQPYAPPARCRYGPAAAHVAHALFWVNLPAVLLCIVLIPFSMFTADESEHAMHTMTAVWLLPVVPACVAANSAGVVSAALPDVPVAVAVGVLG